jgi:hypothetical protein
MAVRLLYDGKTLTWDTGSASTSATFKASSGLIGDVMRVFRFDNDVFAFREDYRCTWYEKTRDKGPIPTGTYRVATTVPRNPYAAEGGPCDLRGSFSIQQIPRGGDPAGPPTTSTAGNCENYWANWGFNRVGLIPTGNVVAKHRSGFYIHDSSKGFTHGCVETEQRFFTDKLLPFARSNTGAALFLHVKYADFRTNGGTFNKTFYPSMPVIDEENQRFALFQLQELIKALRAGKSLGAGAKRPSGLTLDPPPQDRVIAYNSSLTGVVHGGIDIGKLPAATLARLPGGWANFV